MGVPYKEDQRFILVLSQRDIKHPGAGGAEIYLHNALIEIAKEVPVVNIGGYHPEIKDSEEVIDGIYYLRRGTNLFTLILQGIKFYFKYRKSIIAVIDHSNTHQFFTFLWARKKRIFFIHQLTLEIWTYFFGKPLGNLLRLLEEALIRLSRGPTITVSQSTANDLIQRGFKEVYICPEGNFIKRDKLSGTENKQDYLVYVGRLIPYKRVEDAILLAHELKRKLYIIGNGPKKYINKLRELSQRLGSDCEILGYLSWEEKERIVEKAYMLVMPSIREGWGLVITENANLGTPSIVYPVNGTYEAVNYGKAGFVADTISWESMLQEFKKIDDDKYESIRTEAFKFSLLFTWKRTSVVFKEIVKRIIVGKEKTYNKLLNTKQKEAVSSKPNFLS